MRCDRVHCSHTHVISVESVTPKEENRVPTGTVRRNPPSAQVMVTCADGHLLQFARGNENATRYNSLWRLITAVIQVQNVSNLEGLIRGRLTAAQQVTTKET